jgi:hypothetical protein
MWTSFHLQAICSDAARTFFHASAQQGVLKVWPSQFSGCTPACAIQIRSSSELVSEALPLKPCASSGRAHNPYYEPCRFYARKGMLQRFNFANFSKG